MLRFLLLLSMATIPGACEPANSTAVPPVELPTSDAPIHSIQVNPAKPSVREMAAGATPVPVKLTALALGAPLTPMRATVVRGPANGTAQLSPTGDVYSGVTVSVTYQPREGFLGDDSIEIELAGAGASERIVLPFRVIAAPTPKTWYVRAGADGDGSAASPFGRIQRAVDSAGPGDRVIVQAGVYRELVQIECNGLAGAPVRIQAEGSVIIDGENRRPWCIIIGRNSPDHSVGRFVELDGFTCKNPAGIGFPDSDGSAAGILVIGTEGVVVRNCRVYRDDYPGYPQAFPPPDYRAFGIYVLGHNIDTVVEYCTADRMGFGGIGSRLSEGDVGGVPVRPILRWNHVSWNNVDDQALQNFSGGMGFSNGTIAGLMEYNLAHHNGDFGIGTDDSGGHVIRYNIAYRNNHRGYSGGGGDGIKTKPHKSAPAGDLVHHNVAFLNWFVGYNINVFDGGVGARVFHNLAYANGSKGLTVSPFDAPPQASIIMNNVCVANQGRDLNYKARAVGHCNFNFAGDGALEAAYSPQTLSGDARFTNLGLLSKDENGDGTPDVLDPLNDRDAFSSVQAAIEYAREQVRRIFEPADGSPLIDAGVDVESLPDFLERAAWDDPEAQPPWSVNTSTYPDLGPIERRP